MRQLLSIGMVGLVVVAGWTMFACRPAVLPSVLEMVPVEGGNTKLGDGKLWPFHEVQLPRYYMSAKEITNAELAEVFNWAGEKGSIRITKATVRLVPYFKWELLDLDNEYCGLKMENDALKAKTGMENYPIVCISWFGAVAFCNFLSEKEGRDPCYDMETWDLDMEKNGYRLPSADEWEFAARGGVTGRETIYAGSNDADEVAWYAGNAGGNIHPVGLKNPNELGIYDLSGNVREFCTEKMGFYWALRQSDSDAAEIQKGSLRMYRGGSYATDKIQVWSFVSNINYPDYCYGVKDVGFRVVSRADFSM